MSSHGVISVGINEAIDADWDEVKRKYGLPEEYLLYVGRIDKGKLNHIIEYFLCYKTKNINSELKFVLVGGLFSATVPHSDLVYTGFVSENEKYAIIRHSKIIVNPSKFESLSLILLESMHLGKPMLVNGKCEVLKEHCSRSGEQLLLIGIRMILYLNWLAWKRLMNFVCRWGERKTVCENILFVECDNGTFKKSN